MTEPIYRDYDRAALDWQYDNRARVANSAEILAGYQRDSEAAREALRHERNVSFGPTEPERLDLFMPQRATTEAPVQVFFHGGYWRALDAADFSFVATPIVAAGGLCVVVNYALIPTVDMAELLRQCRAALAWVQQNIAGHGGDPERIYISGHSAGGHIVASLLGRPESAAQIAGAVAISGIFELEPIRLCFLNEELHLTEADVSEHSPLHRLPTRSVPLQVVYGADESEEFARQSQNYAAAVRDAGGACEVGGLVGEDHMTIAAGLREAGKPIAKLLRTQMGLA